MIQFLRGVAELLIVMWLVRLVMKLFTGAGRRATAGPGPARGGPPERAGGTLVRDPQCGTYLPAARAIRVGQGDAAVYFCSAACRDAYATAHVQ